LVYLHVGRGLYYGSYKAPRTLVWTIGTVILVLMMATAFLGYLHSPKWHIYTHTYWYINYKHKRSPEGNTNFHKKDNTKGRRYYSTSIKPTNGSIISNFLNEKLLNTVIIFENLHKEEVKSQINLYSKGKSGIYLILNLVTLDYYIGSASTNRFYSRYYNHLIGYTGSKILKLAVKKYKLENFVFIVLEEFPEVVSQENNKRLLDLEDFYLKSLLPNYNILTEAGNSFGYKHTEITRINMKANYSEERRLKIGNLNLGKSLNNETKEKLRKAALQRLPRVFSEDALSNLKKASKPLVLYNKDGTVYGEYPSITSASVDINCSIKTIYRALKSDSKILKRRWIVRYGTNV